VNITKPRLQPLARGVGIAGWGTAAYVVACLLPLTTAVVIELLAIPVPYMDEWAWTDLVYRLHVGSLTFGDLWAQHNEHRMLIPNLIALGLAALGGWNQLRETLFSLLLVVLTQIGIFVLLRRIIALEKLPYVFLAASLMLYSLAQMENWNWGFQLAWFLCNACAVWAVLLLGTSGQSWFAWLAAAAVAVIASFSSSQGLMVWFAGLATLGLTEKRRPTQIVAWIALGIGVFAVYFHGWEHPSYHPDPLLAVYHPLTTVRYIGAYFGSVFAGWISFDAAMFVGWASLLVLAALMWSVIASYRRDRTRAARANSFMGLAVYALCVSAITTAGRVGFGETQAQASRYTSIAIYCWITIFALGVGFGLPTALRLPSRLRLLPTARLLQIVFVVLGVLYAGADRAGIALGKGAVAQVQLAYPALIVGRGRELMELFPEEAPVEDWIRKLQAVKDGPYYK
jgi:hypothetical protein